MNSVTEEKVAQLEKHHDDKQIELNNLISTRIEKMWFDELDVLELEYIKYRDERIRSMGTYETSLSKSNIVKQKVTKPKSVSALAGGRIA
jgi:hypothetical protein